MDQIWTVRTFRLWEDIVQERTIRSSVRIGKLIFEVRHIASLNQEADEETTYKVIYLSRHGQGVHNLVSLVPLLSAHRVSSDSEKAEEKYGTPAWNCKWSLLETDGELVWVRPRAKLAKRGKARQSEDNLH